MHHFRTMLVLALFCALLAGFTPALAQGGSGDETIVIHQMNVRNTSIDLSGTPPTILIDYDIEDVSEDNPGLEMLVVHPLNDEGELIDFDFRVVSGSAWFADHPLRATGTLELEVPALLPPGEYDLAVTVYRFERIKVIDSQLDIATPGTVTLFRGGDGPWNTPPSFSGIYGTIEDTNVTYHPGSHGYHVRMLDNNRSGLVSLTVELFKDGVSTGSRVSHVLPDDMARSSGPPPGGYLSTGINLPQTLSDGEHEVVFTVTDASGLSSTESRTLDVTNFRDEDTPPVIESVSFRDESIDLGEKYTPPPFIVLYEFSDVGIGVSKVDYILVNQEDASDRQTRTIAFDSPTLSVSGSHSLTNAFDLNAGRYTLAVRLYDDAGNETYAENLDSIEITSDDTQNPYVNSLTLTPNQIETSPTVTPASLNYSLRDPGTAGLRELSLTLRDVNDASRTYAITPLRFTRESRLDSQTRISLPASLPAGEYFLRYELKDAAGNTEVGSANERLTVTGGPVGPVFTALGAASDRIFTNDPSGELVVTYALQDGDERGLGWIQLSLESETLPNAESGNISLGGVATAHGAYGFPLNTLAPGRYRLVATARDTQNNEATTRDVLAGTPEFIDVLAPNQRRFGPFDWAGAGTTEHPFRDIYRLSGLSHGAPVAITYESTQHRLNEVETCAVDIVPQRYNGSEYLILSQDIPAQCNPQTYQQAQMLITFAHADDMETSTLSRFKISPHGHLTDMGSDHASAPLAFDSRQALQLEFGPFEWVENGQSRQHQILFSNVSGVRQIDLAFANASNAGFAGAFTDCTIHRTPASRDETHFLLSPAMLAACGDFGRADLTVRLSAPDPWIQPYTSAARLITTTENAVSDFSADFTPARSPELTSQLGGLTLAVYPAFEWTGDANAPTSNLFRLAGLNGGAPVSITLRALQDEDWTDCDIPVSVANTGAFDYVLTSQALAACDAFGRADLQFRVTYATANQRSAPPALRRLAVGAHGDLTDFGFDLDDRDALAPTPIADGMAEIVFGPFEWTGDHTVSTQNVFRISGITGAPDSIDLALMNATTEGYTGDFTDCSLLIRPYRVGRNEFVIASNDLVDCGGFLRADIRFRVRAQADQFEDEVRMRRFAVTRSGGLTDFGSDNPR
ncbi:Ig-like domain repeat protein [Oceanicaulis sp. LC35]|uniref:Ig-like domain repeat protein n=1 Tax=Oceanicaulis sp. LC35 TaxID=3349635 RepID=UPI003F83BB0B